MSQSCLLSDNYWLCPLSGVNHSCASAVTRYILGACPGGGRRKEKEQ